MQISSVSVYKQQTRYYATQTDRSRRKKRAGREHDDDDDDYDDE